MLTKTGICIQTVVKSAPLSDWMKTSSVRADGQTWKGQGIEFQFTCKRQRTRSVNCFSISFLTALLNSQQVSRCCRQMAVVSITALSTASSAVDALPPNPATAVVSYTALKGGSCSCPRRDDKWGGRGLAPFVLSLRIRQTGVIRFTSRPLHP